MIKIDVSNIKGVQNALSKYGDDAVKEFGKTTKITAQEIENKAKTLAPVNKLKNGGTLRQSIQSEKQKTKLSYKVTAYAPYAAFQEFGTGGKVDIKEGWGEMAAQFKGQGIKQINLTPQPFMYPAFVYGRSIYKDDMEESIKYLNKKFNNG